MAKLTIIPVCSKFHNTGIGIVETWHCRVSVSTTAHKILNINNLPAKIVESVSKLSFQCGSRDAKFCVSTIWLDKLLILNVLYVVANIETRHATSLLMAKSHFDTPSTATLK